MFIFLYFFFDFEGEDDFVRLDLFSVLLEFMFVLVVLFEFFVGVELVCEVLGVFIVVDEFILLFLVDVLVKSFFIFELVRILVMVFIFLFMELKYFVLLDFLILEWFDLICFFRVVMELKDWL